MGLKEFFIRDREKEAKAEKSLKDAPAKADSVVAREKPEDDIIDVILSGKDIITKIDTPFGEFEYKYPNGADELNIAHRRAAYLGGYRDDSFDANTRLMFTVWATLDILVVKKPEKFASVSSWADFPDRPTALDIFQRGLVFREGIQDRISGAGPGDVPGKGKPENS